MLETLKPQQLEGFRAELEYYHIKVSITPSSPSMVGPSPDTTRRVMPGRLTAEQRQKRMSLEYDNLRSKLAQFTDVSLPQDMVREQLRMGCSCDDIHQKQIKGTLLSRDHVNLIHKWFNASLGHQRSHSDLGAVLAKQKNIGRIIYKATTHGFSAIEFHKKCDKHVIAHHKSHEKLNIIRDPPSSLLNRQKASSLEDTSTGVRASYKSRTRRRSSSH